MFCGSIKVIVTDKLWSIRRFYNVPPRSTKKKKFLSKVEVIKSTKEIKEQTLSPGGFARMIGVFWMSGAGGSSLPSWGEKTHLFFKNNSSYTCPSSASCAHAHTYPSFSRLVFSISTRSRQILSRRSNFSFSPSSSPPPSLPVQAGLAVAGFWHF